MANVTTMEKPALSPAADALDRIAEALLRVEGRLRHVESAVSHVVRRLHSLGASDLCDFQELDRAVQEIEALAAFARKLAAIAPKDWTLDLQRATESLTLESMREALGGRPPAAATSEGGDIEFF